MEHQTLGRWVICPSDPAYYVEDCRILAYCPNIYAVHWTESEMQTVAEFEFPKADSCPGFQ